MRRIVFISIISIIINVVLASWLVNNYYYDQNFKSWVDLAYAQYYPYIVVSVGLGGGSLLGYFLLKSKRREITGKFRLERARPQKPSSMPVLSRASEQAVSPSSSAQTTKHIAYAVPPPIKPVPQSVQRPPPSPAWGMKSPAPGKSQYPENAPFSAQTAEGPRREILGSAASVSRVEPNSPPLSRQGPPPSPRMTPPLPWRPEPRPSPEGRVEPRSSIPQPPETGFKTNPQQWNQPPLVQASKWQPPESGVRPLQRSDTIPAQGFPPKWVPPPGQASRPAESGPQRPGVFPPPRAPFGQPQPQPRPLAYPRPARPLEPSGLARPKPIMSEARPPMVTPSKLPNQGSVSGAPGSPQSPPGPLTEKKQRPANLAEKLPEKAADTGQGELQNPPVKTTADAESLPSGELDWDTALDTILKTLRKEKVETK